MKRSVMPTLSTLFEYIRTILYREIRDVYLGFPRHLRWFIMRKVARFKSTKSLAHYLRRRAAQLNITHDISHQENTIFHDIDSEHVIDCLRKDGVYLGLNLPTDLVEQIVQFAKQTRCYGNGKPNWGFNYYEKKYGVTQAQHQFLDRRLL